jgi:hypothetical protein
MNRFLQRLALFSLALLLATAAVGLALRLGDIRRPDDLDAQFWKRIHFFLGVFSALSVVLVNSIVATYFIGTSRWVREVVEAYDLDWALVVESNRLKRGTFPLALGSMLTAVAVAALGAAADPAAGLKPPPIPGLENWGPVHLLGAGLGTMFIVYAYLTEASQVGLNAGLIGRIMELVRARRIERGLPIDDDASEEGPPA